jgi:glycine betaine catabolism A
MSVPLDPAAIQRALLPFGHSRLLPREAYVDPEVFAWESEHFLRRRWVCVAMSADLANPGDQLAVRVADTTGLLTRGRDGVVRGFANTCRHRGHELLPCGGSRNARAVVCPYHAWGYGLDGELVAAPNFRGVEGFDKSEFGLLALPTEELAGYVWVNASGDAGSLADQVGTLADVLEPYSIASLVAMERHEYVVEANWKILCENYNECYHCPSIHPELCQVTEVDSGLEYEGTGAWVGGWMDLMPDGETMSLDGKTKGLTIPGLDPHRSRTVGYVDVFPNLLVSPHPDYVMTHLLTPLSAGSTHIVCTWSFPAADRDLDGFDPAYAVDFWDLTNRQDWSACESVQRGLSAPQWTPGPIAPLETTVYRFDSMIAHGYVGEALVPNPLSQPVVSKH